MNIILIRRFLRSKHISDMFRSIMEHLQGESHQVVYIKHEMGLKLKIKTTFVMMNLDIWNSIK
jgi:hypothetical protein